MPIRLALRLAVLPLVAFATLSAPACGGARSSRKPGAFPAGTAANPLRMKLAAGGSVDITVDRADSTFSLALRTRADTASRAGTRLRMTAEAARWWADSVSRIVDLATDGREVRLRLAGRSEDPALELVRPASGGSKRPVHARSTADGSTLTLRPEEMRRIAREMQLIAYVLAPTPDERTEGQLYLEFEVEKPVIPASGCVPRYPESLRLRGITGEVRTRFVIDTAGRAEPATIRVLETTHPDFVPAVEAAVPCMRFKPAEVNGRRVRQVVLQPFSFELAI